MNLFSFIPLDSLLETLSEIWDIQLLLHTAGIEFTVKREDGYVIGFEINIQCLLAENSKIPESEIPQIFKKNTNGGRIP